MKHLKLKELEKSYELGLVTKEEYEKNKKEIEEMPEEEVKEVKEEIKEVKLKSDKMLIIGAIVLVLLFGIILGFRYFTQEQPETIDDLHALNLKGKLKEDQGYLYKGIYSFVKFDDLWLTQLKSPKGTILYDIQFRYGPKEVEDIRISGTLNTKRFNDATQYYATFNPLGNDFTHIRLARLDYDIQMTKIFQKIPVSACDRNVTNGTTACVGIPIITCDNTNDMVVYFKESEELKLEYDDNCIVISGSGLDLVKGVDRILYDLYDIIE